MSHSNIWCIKKFLNSGTQGCSNVMIIETDNDPPLFPPSIVNVKQQTTLLKRLHTSLVHCMYLLQNRNHVILVLILSSSSGCCQTSKTVKQSMRSTTNQWWVNKKCQLEEQIKALKHKREESSLLSVPKQTESNGGWRRWLATMNSLYLVLDHLVGTGETSKVYHALTDDGYSCVVKV